ncbi:MAG: hypothetical protein QNL01_12925 [Akkermansiaceae bacterium]|jgi:hypothetical protein|tara:strand:+ start:122 stop:778 length:657 start_codon:yes stop_codon:yes gene_type:complete
MNTTLKNHILGSMTKAAMGAILLPLLVSAGQLQAQAAGAQKKYDSSKNVRIMRNENGSYTEFKRSSDERVIERRTYGDRSGGSGDRVLHMSIIYRKDIYGKLRSGIVYDGSGKKLYRVVYGYHKQTGALVAEDMFDARAKRTKTLTDEKTGLPYEKEYPVRYLRYRYDAQGRQLKPVVFCLPPGKRAEELFGKDGSTHSDPWSKNRGRTINPNARPTR